MDTMTVVSVVAMGTTLMCMAMLFELIIRTHRLERMTERNAAQAVTIMGLQARLNRRDTPENPANGKDLGLGSYPSTSGPSNGAVRGLNGNEAIGTPWDAI